jgi:hypothetical protein
MRFTRLGLFLLIAIASPAFCEDLTVTLPAKSQVHVATAIERDSAVNVGGDIAGNEVRFANLVPDTPYDLAIELTDGRLLCGADMSWCDPTPADPQAEPMGDDDREAIRAIVQDILGFADKPKLAMLLGDHDRAVGLVDLTRSKGFHSDKGDEVIWRVEVWFFNQSRLLRRERFGSTSDYQKEIGRVRWVPALGGVVVAKGAGPKTVSISADAINSAATNSPGTKASGSPADSPLGNRSQQP